MARRPIAAHPAFAPLIALWFAALLGLSVAVLPAPALERFLDASGLGAFVPLTLPGRAAASAMGAGIGALLGYALAQPFARRAAGDPRPLYAEAEPPFEDTEEAPAPRPLRVREEFGGGFGDDSEVSRDEQAELDTDLPNGRDSEAAEGFMILTPQPAHPPRPEADLETLLEKFDTAFEAFRSGGESVSGISDPVQAFVAQQTGAQQTGAPSRAFASAASPLGGRAPDHQAELRAALGKLARSQRGE